MVYFSALIDGILSWELILAGDKTETWRPKKDGAGTAWAGLRCIEVHSYGARQWVVGRTYAVCPKRGEKAIARIRLLSITPRKAGDIPQSNLISEGFEQVVVGGCYRRERFLSVIGRFYKGDPAKLDGYSLGFELVAKADAKGETE